MHISGEVIAIIAEAINNAKATDDAEIYIKPDGKGKPQPLAGPDGTVLKLGNLRDLIAPFAFWAGDN